MKVAEYSKVLNNPNNFLESDFPWKVHLHYTVPQRTENDKWYDAYKYNFINEGLNSLFQVGCFSCIFM